MTSNLPDIVVERHRFVMAAPLVAKVLNGAKITTVRYEPSGIERPASEVLPMYAATGDLREFVCDLVISKYEYKRFGELNSSDARLDGFETVAELKDALAGFYGHLGGRDTVCIYSIRPADVADAHRRQVVFADVA